MLVRTVNKTVATLPALYRLVLKQIYEPKNLSLTDEYMMKQSFISWANKASKNEEEQYVLCHLAKLIQDNEAGKFDIRKASFKENGIDYKRFHRLPEAMTYDKDRIKKIHNIINYERSRRN